MSSQRWLEKLVVQCVDRFLHPIPFLMQPLRVLGFFTGWNLRSFGYYMTV